MTENYPPYPHKLVPEGAGGSIPAGGEPYYPPTPEGGSKPTGGQAPPTGFNRRKFVESYANMVARTWTDDTYLELINSNPAETLKAAGLQPTEGAVFRIIHCKITGMGNVDQQVDAWVEGYRTGLFDLYLPIKPDDIDVTPGGGDPGACAGGGCCCTPCCCCT
jgi:hypothetical protein